MSFVELGRAEVRRFGGQVVEGRAVRASGQVDGFVIGLEDGRQMRGRRVVLATGLVDELPDVAGLTRRWGRDVLHCPYCHGWEIRDRRIGVLATSRWAVHQALLFRPWTPEVTLLTHTQPYPSDDDLLRLQARNIAFASAPSLASRSSTTPSGQRRCTTRPGVALEALAVQTRLHVATPLLAGLATVDHPLGVG